MTPRNPGTRIVTKIIFPVVDMDEALGFYQRLGFSVNAYDGQYAWVLNGDAEVLHLALVAELNVAANHGAGYLHVQDAAAWHQEWSAADVQVGPLQDQPWGMREFELRDPSGNLLRVGQNL